MIECRQLAKSFHQPVKEPGVRAALRSFISPSRREIVAVTDFSMLIEGGGIVGLLGPNGAGKTTLMKMLTGIIAPSAGDARVLGFRPFERRREFRKRISLVMGQKSQLWWDIPAMDSFLLLRSYYEVPERQFNARLTELAELLDVRRLLNVHVRRLSLGERMKMELIASLLHEPDILFLDEPTIGLDVVAQRSIRSFISEYQERRGITILLTSHYMADVEALCSRLVLILEGRKRFDGSLREFETLLGSEKVVHVTFASPVDTADPLWAELQAQWSEEGSSVEIRIKEAELRERMQQIFAHYPVADFGTAKLPIERVMESLLAQPGLLT